MLIRGRIKNDFLSSARVIFVRAVPVVVVVVVIGTI